MTNKELVIDITTIRKASSEDVKKFREAINNLVNEDPCETSSTILHICCDIHGQNDF